MYLPANIIDVFKGVVFGGRSPSSKNHGHGIAMVVVDVATQEHETCPESIFDMDELLEVGVGGVADFAEPDVADADVQGVVVADSTWNDAGFLVHELRVTKVALSLTRRRIADAGQHMQV